VSAVSASPAAVGSTLDPVRALQHALYRAAKADPGRRFHALRDKVFRSDVLWRAWVMVRRNDGAVTDRRQEPVDAHGRAQLTFGDPVGQGVSSWVRIGISRVTRREIVAWEQPNSSASRCWDRLWRR
jgi:hypothetical protein